MASALQTWAQAGHTPVGTRRRPPHPRAPTAPKPSPHPPSWPPTAFTHSGAAPAPVPALPKGLRPPGSKLAAHLWTHAPTRPYPCPDCPKSFCYPSAGGPPPHAPCHRRPAYPCPHCPKAFSFLQTGGPSPVPRLPDRAGAARPPRGTVAPAAVRRLARDALLLVHQRSHQAESPGERESASSGLVAPLFCQPQSIKRWHL